MNRNILQSSTRDRFSHLGFRADYNARYRPTDHTDILAEQVDDLDGPRFRPPVDSNFHDATAPVKYYEPQYQGIPPTADVDGTILKFEIITSPVAFSKHFT